MIKFDIDTLRMSHILSLKKIFRSYAGKTPIRLTFVSKNETVGSVYIDASWGVEHRLEIEEKVRCLPSLEALHWEF
jgi:hypothetical protein